jgi:hypothetical protein
MTEKFENILEKCLERITEKGESIEVCLRDYPEHAFRLEPLLRTAISASSCTHHIQAVSEVKLRAKNKMLSEMQCRRNKKAKMGRVIAWKYRWALPAMLLLLLLVGSGVVMAANDSMPDESLYPVKTTVEKIQLKLTPSDLNKARFHVKLAERRAKEMVAMEKKNEAQEVEKLANNVKQELNKTALLAESMKTQKNGETKVAKLQSRLQRSILLTSSNSLPHEPLYQVKLATEETMIKLTTSELSVAKLRIEFAEQRVQKIVEMSNNNNFQALDELSQSVEQNLGNLNTLVDSLVSQEGKEGDVEEIRALLENDATKNLNIYKETMEKASPQVRPVLEPSLRRSLLRFNMELAYLNSIKQNTETKLNNGSP